MAKSLILCDCMGTQTVNPEAIAGVCDVACSRIHTALCTTQIMSAAKLMEEGDTIIACQQERVRFEEFAEEIGVEPPGFVDLRDRAGWSEQGADVAPKMAALVAEALLPAAAVRSLDVVSEGQPLKRPQYRFDCRAAGRPSYDFGRGFPPDPSQKTWRKVNSVPYSRNARGRKRVKNCRTKG